MGIYAIDDLKKKSLLMYQQYLFLLKRGKENRKIEISIRVALKKKKKKIQMHGREEVNNTFPNGETS